MPVADVLDLSEVEVWAKVGELDRANLKEGQDALLQLDAIPDKQFHGKIKTLSGTATSDVFSGDPSKKFDVVFSVDMRQLLSGLGMKPAEIDGIMATAAENAKKNPGGGAILGGVSREGEAPGGAPGAAGNQDQGGGQGRGGRGGRGGGMSATDQQKMQDLIKQSQNSSPAERQKLIEQFTASLTSGPASSGRGGGGRGGEGRGGEGRGGEGRGGGGRQADAAAGGADGRGASGGGAQNATGRAGDNSLQELVRRYSVTQYTEDERNNAKLPLPPEKNAELQVLLRPGLLADVEIQVEKIPDALHVPAQAVFQKNGKPTVFVEGKNKKFEPREVQLVKQSESMMVLASGVAAGDIVALADPTAQKTGKKETGEKKSQGSPMGGMGGGK
jgi:hypothetical protein